MNLLKGTIERDDERLAVRLDDGTRIPLPGRDIPLADGSPVTLGIRPEHILPGADLIELRVDTAEILGSQTILHTTLRSGEPFTAALSGIRAAKSGDVLRTGFSADFVHLFDEAGQTIGATENWQEILSGVIGATLRDARSRLAGKKTPKIIARRRACLSRPGETSTGIFFVCARLTRIAICGSMPVKSNEERLRGFTARRF